MTVITRETLAKIEEFGAEIDFRLGGVTHVGHTTGVDDEGMIIVVMIHDDDKIEFVRPVDVEDIKIDS